MQAPQIQASGVITTGRDLRARCLFLFLLVPVFSMVSFCKQIKYNAHVQYKNIIDSINTSRNAPILIMKQIICLGLQSRSCVSRNRTAFGRTMMRAADSGII